MGDCGPEVRTGTVRSRVATFTSRMAVGTRTRASRFDILAPASLVPVCAPPWAEEPIPVYGFGLGPFGQTPFGGA